MVRVFAWLMLTVLPLVATPSALAGTDMPLDPASIMTEDVRAEYVGHVGAEPWARERYDYTQHVYVFDGSLSYHQVNRSIVEAGALPRSLARVPMQGGRQRWIVPVWAQRGTHWTIATRLRGLVLIDSMRSRYTTHFPADVKMSIEAWDELRQGLPTDVIAATLVVDTRADFQLAILRIRDEAHVDVENAAMWDDLGYGLIAIRGPRRGISRIIRLPAVVDARLDAGVIAH